MHLKGITITSHPPIILPEIGGGKELLAEKTIRGIKDVALKIAEIKPQIILCITPHGHVFRDGFAVAYSHKLSGNMGAFGAENLKIEKECDLGLLEYMNQCFAQDNLETLFLNEGIEEEYQIKNTIDYATFVPLYYIDKVYKDYKIVQISISSLPLIDHYKLGKAIRKAIEMNKKDTIILASADLSHCLKEQGSYSYHPAGKIFDDKIVTYLKERKYESILNFSASEYEEAQQCGLRPIVTALGATDSIKTKSEIFSYEGPFGVGYLTGMITFDIDGDDLIVPSVLEKFLEDKKREQRERRLNEDTVLKLARGAIDEMVKHGKKIKIEDYLSNLDTQEVARLKKSQSGVFVSIYKYGELRGCMGTTHSVTENLVEEIMRNAIEAACFDPRFYPVEAADLDDLEISVDIIKEIENINDVSQLDPQKYGIILEVDLKRGVLLPNISRINTAQEQLAVAKEKAGITELDANLPQFIQRFTTEKHAL